MTQQRKVVEVRRGSTIGPRDLAKCVKRMASLSASMPVYNDWKTCMQVHNPCKSTLCWQTGCVIPLLSFLPPAQEAATSERGSTLGTRLYT